MTTFGKILVFLNLVFALLAGGLIGLVFLTRTNWRVAHEQLVANVDAYKTSTQVYVDSQQRRINDQSAEATRLRNAAREADDKYKASATDLEKARTDYQTAKKAADAAAETVKAYLSEVERRRAEVSEVNVALRDRDQRIKDLEKSLTETRNEAVDRKLQYDSLKERYALVISQNEEMSKDLARAKSLGLDTAVATRRPPVEQVRGTVKAVKDNLATVSIGTDAGVNKNNVLQLYRLSPKEEWLGELTILAATPHEAVGRITPRNRQVIIKVGDEAASRITIQK